MHAVPRAIKTIVARWVALEDDGNSEEEEEEEEEEGNSEAEGGENFSVNEVFQLFWYVVYVPVFEIFW